MCPRIALAATCLLTFGGCTQHAFVDTVMSSAHRAPLDHEPLLGTEIDGRSALLAGDFHCHLSPPDADWDVGRDLDDTLALARAERLDFIVLTPHVPALFFTDPDALASVRTTQLALRAAIERADTGDLLVIPGFEYTDHSYGLVGMAALSS